MPAAKAGARKAQRPSVAWHMVVSHSVAQRTHEIGGRLALGARPAEIGRLLRRQSLVSVGIGLVSGLLIAALALNRVFSAMLFGIRATIRGC
jgi:putative ABC transport system permease protein